VTSPKGKALSLIKPRMPQRQFASRARTTLIRLTRNLRVGAKYNSQTDSRAVAKYSPHKTPRFLVRSGYFTASRVETAMTTSRRPRRARTLPSSSALAEELPEEQSSHHSPVGDKREVT
jgi:hypothetical protein